MKDLPLISVIVPIYNVENYLSHCIDSILIQSYRNLDILLINDGSTDKSEQICLQYKNQDTRIKYVYKNNSGVSTTRNTGLKLAKGDFIYFIDADDYIHPQTLEIMYKNLNEGNYDFSMILGKITYNKNQNPINIPANIEKKIIDQNYLMKGLFNLAIEEELQYQVVWNKLYRKEILKDLYFIKTGTEDTEFNCRVYQKCNKAILIKLPLYNWVQRNTSITHQPINNNYIDRIHSYYQCFLNIPDEYKQYKGYCIEKLYKTMINIRYYATNTPYETISNHNLTIIHNRLYSKFWKSNISCIKKIGITIFLYFPFFYNLFIYLAQKKATIN